MTDLVARMRGLPLFSTLDEPQLALLADSVTEVEFPAGATLITQGEDSRECYVILEGSADITADNRGGVVDTVGVGDAVGEMALILGWERTANVVATEPIKAVAVSRQALVDNPGINDALTQYLYDKIEEIEMGGKST